MPLHMRIKYSADMVSYDSDTSLLQIARLHENSIYLSIASDIG